MRVIVLGGLGLFGRAAAKQLRAVGIPSRTASRGPRADLRIDANDAASIRGALSPGDLVIDAAGPFHARTTALVETAIETGFDVIDLNDDLGYAEKILSLKPRIDAAGIRVLSSASSVSAISAAVVQYSGINAPVRLTSFLAPASRHTANAGTALSLLRSLGQPVRIFHDGRLQSAVGWSESRRFSMPAPLGTLCGRLFESADALYLPRIWPSLGEVAMFVDANTRGVNILLDLVAKWPWVRRVMEHRVKLGTALVRRFGSTMGGVGYEIKAADGKIRRYAIISTKDSFLVAIAPAVLAVRAIIESRFDRSGLVMPDQYVKPLELIAYLQSLGITFTEVH